MIIDTTIRFHQALTNNLVFPADYFDAKLISKECHHKFAVVKETFTWNYGDDEPDRLFTMDEIYPVECRWVDWCQNWQMWIPGRPEYGGGADCYWLDTTELVDKYFDIIDSLN